MRPRDPSRLASAPYDVLVIGGGIIGLACAYEGASRGLRVALVEARDFGAGTSFNHQKTVHGGLRSLQSLSIGRAREAIRERRALARMAPWLLRPLPFIVGTYRSITRSRLALRGAFAFDGWLARDRNDRVEPELHLPRARLLSRTATMKLFPGIRQDGLTGGAQWYDYQMVESDRLTFAVAAAADRAGADLATYVAADGVIRRDGRVAGIRARDVLAGTELEIEGRSLINAAGAAAGDVMRLIGVSRPFPLVKAMNLVTTRSAHDVALAAPDRKGRMLTLVPWQGRVIVGTGQSTSAVNANDEVRAQDVEEFAADANHAFPALDITPADVVLVHRALVPGTILRDGRAELLSASQIVTHRRDGAEGAFSVIGAKYTTARAVAERAIDLIGRATGQRLAPSRTAHTSLPFAGIADHEALAIETGRRLGVDLPLPSLQHLVRRYAEAAAEIVRIISERPDTAAPLSEAVPTLRAEVVHAIRNEAAVRLSDVLMRRTALGATGHPGRAAVDACAALCASDLHWTPARVDAEIAEIEGIYRIPG